MWRRWIRRVPGLVSALSCRLHGGHLFELQQGTWSMWLQCVSCPHRTPGWDLSMATPVARRRLGLDRSKWSTSTPPRVANG